MMLLVFGDPRRGRHIAIEDRQRCGAGVVELHHLGAVSLQNSFWTHIA